MCVCVIHELLLLDVKWLPHKDRVASTQGGSGPGSSASAGSADNASNPAPKKRKVTKPQAPSMFAVALVGSNYQ